MGQTPPADDDEVFRNAQAELAAACREGLSFQAAVGALVGRYGPFVAGRAVATSMKRPVGVWTNHRGRVFVGDSSPGGGWKRTD
jgi:hypothetical protein